MDCVACFYKRNNDESGKVKQNYGETSSEKAHSFD